MEIINNRNIRTINQQLNNNKDKESIIPKYKDKVK